MIPATIVICPFCKTHVRVLRPPPSPLRPIFLSCPVCRKRGQATDWIAAPEPIQPPIRKVG